MTCPLCDGDGQECPLCGEIEETKWVRVGDLTQDMTDVLNVPNKTRRLRRLVIETTREIFSQLRAWEQIFSNRRCPTCKEILVGDQRAFGEIECPNCGRWVPVEEQLLPVPKETEELSETTRTPTP